MHAFLKTEFAEALSSAGALASYGGDTYSVVDCHAGEEPDDGVEVECWVTPGDVMACF